MPGPFGWFGFGAGDRIELGLAATLVFLFLIWPVAEPWFRVLAVKPGLCLLLLVLAPVALRLGLLVRHPVPAPSASDEFSALLAADTLCHLRLANPSPTMPQFFAAPLVLTQPAYGSVRPPGAAIPLALGRAIFGHPWAGVLCCVAALCGGCYWMSAAWTNPRWALAGGALAVVAFGPLNAWMNEYRVGAFAALSGCLVFGALPRFARKRGAGAAAILGAGFGMALLASPSASIFLFVSAALFFLLPFRNRIEWQALTKLVAIVALPVAGATGVLLLQNKQMTGSWTVMPVALPFGFAGAAMVSPLVLVMITLGLQQVNRRVASGREISMILAFLCIFHFLFWYGVRLSERADHRRAAIEHQLSEAPGKQLVFVRYFRPNHEFQDEWVFNDADIDAARVVRARDRGAAQNGQLLPHYRGRTVWLLEPDINPPRLTAYRPEPPPSQPDVKAPEPARKKPPANKPLLQFEPVPQAR